MAAPYGNFDFYRGAQSRANRIQNRDTQRQQSDPLRESIMGTPLQTQEEPQRIEVPTDGEGTQFSLKPYVSGNKLQRPLPTGSMTAQGRGESGALGGFTKAGLSRSPRARYGTLPGVPEEWESRTGSDGRTLGALRDEYAGLLGGQPGADFFNRPTDEGTGSANPLIASITGAPTTQASSAPTSSLDSSQWNTEGWATPSYLGKAAGGPMAGWDQTNWDDQNMQTPKYVVGRILSNYTPSMEGLGQAMQEIQQAYPGAEFDGKDKIIIPGLGTIDVLVNAGGDNQSWAWQDLTNSPDTQGANNPLAQSITKGASDPTSALLGGLDPALLNDPTWRQLLASLGIKL